MLKSEEVLELGSTFDEAVLALVDTAQGRSQRSPESRVSVGIHLLGPGFPPHPGSGYPVLFHLVVSVLDSSMV